jgi:hypothetical protein
MAAAGEDVLMRRLAAVLVLVPLVAGCGAAISQDATVSPDILAASADKVRDAGSSRLTWDMKLEASGDSGEMTGAGLFDYRRNVGHLTYDLSEFDSELEKVEMIADGSVVFVSDFGEELAPGKSWLKVDTADVPGGGKFVGALGQIDSPVEELKYLRAVSKEIEEKGKEEVRGVPTTHYRAVIDVPKLGELAASEAPPASRKQMRREAMARFEKMGVDEAPMDVWVDEGGLPRKMTLQLAFEVEGEKAKTEISVEFFDFGVPVRVTHPPASETVDLSDAGVADLLQEGE